MKQKTLLTCILLVSLLLAAGCTEQQRAKDWGGKASVQLPPGQKLVCVSWEQMHLWYLYRPMRTNEVPENYVLKESSSFGLMQGEVDFSESK